MSLENVIWVSSYCVRNCVRMEETQEKKKKKQARERTRKSLRIVVNNIPIGIVPKSIQYIYSPNNQFPREYSQLIQHWSQLKIIRETFFYTTLIKKTKATRYIYIYIFPMDCSHFYNIESNWGWVTVKVDSDRPVSSYVGMWTICEREKETLR